jgi:hypothetical protein
MKSSPHIATYKDKNISGLKFIEKTVPLEGSRAV